MSRASTLVSHHFNPSYLFTGVCQDYAILYGLFQCPLSSAGILTKIDLIAIPDFAAGELVH